MDVHPEEVWGSRDACASLSQANAGGYRRVMPVTRKGRPVTWGQGQWSLEVVGARDERVEPGGPSAGRLRRVAPAGGDMGCTAPRVRPSASQIPGRRRLSTNGRTSKGPVDPGRLGERGVVPEAVSYCSVAPREPKLL